MEAEAATAAASSEPTGDDAPTNAAAATEDSAPTQQNMANAANDSMAAATSMNVLETYLQNFNEELQTPVPGGAAAVGGPAKPVAVKGEDGSPAAGSGGGDDSAEEEGALTVVENQQDPDPSVPAAPAAVPVAVTEGNL